jgi:hypothetical protein
MARVARPVGPRGPRSVLGALLVLTLLASVSGPARRVTAASPEPGAPLPQRWSAAIRAGDCQHLGDLITPLTDLTVPHGRLIGHGARTLPAASSFTRVPLPFDALLAIDDAIVVQAATPTRPVIACGAIGGVIDRNGALTIGVRGFPRLDTPASPIYRRPRISAARTSLSFSPRPSLRRRLEAWSGERRAWPDSCLAWR